MKLETLLLEIFEKLRLHGISYTDFFLLFIKSYGYLPNEISLLENPFERNIIITKMKKLAEIVTKLPDTLSIMRNQVCWLKKQGVQPFLVDCLGLPEMYEIYKVIVEKYGILSVAFKLYINSRAITYKFRSKFQKSSMSELAQSLGTSLYRRIDKIVHGDLSSPMELDKLVSCAEARIKDYVDALVKDVVSYRYAFIVSDHGYDIYWENHEYYLGHGRDSKFAKIAPLIFFVQNEA